MNPTEPYSRAAFNAIVATSRAAERSAGRVLAGLAVGLGVMQLLFFRWAEHRLAERTVTVIGGAAFLVYIVLVTVAFTRLLRVRRASGPVCPECGRVFDETGLRIVTASESCDGCGGRVLAS